jgi:N-acetylneuraminate synthase
MIVHEDLLKMIAEEGKHTFISTGMTQYEDIQKAVNIFRKADCSFELMHTVSTYPMKDEDANLNMIKTLKKKFNCNIGYSGHEVGLAVSYAAAALDITSLERHITLDRAMYGSDQSASVEPSGLRQLVGGVRKIEQAMGDGEKRIIDAETPIAQKLREHLDWEASN